MPYHISESGPKPCSTTPDRCPVTRETGGKHYDTLAEAYIARESDLDREYGPLGLGQRAAKRAKKSRLPNKNLYGKTRKLPSDSDTSQSWRKNKIIATREKRKNIRMRKFGKDFVNSQNANLSESHPKNENRVKAIAAAKYLASDVKKSKW